MPVRSRKRALSQLGPVQRISWQCMTLAPAIHGAATVIDLASRRNSSYVRDGATPSPAVAPQPRSDLHQLTPRERMVIELVVRGATDREIARDLRISTNTVNEYMRKIKRKLGAANRVSVATLYYGDIPYYTPAPDEAPPDGASVEVAPIYTRYVHECVQVGHGS